METERENHSGRTAGEAHRNGDPNPNACRAGGAFDAVFEASSDAMKLVDLDGRIMRWNQAAQELHGWSAAEVVGEVMPHIPPDMRRRSISDIRAVAASGRSATREAVVLKKGGISAKVWMVVIPYVDADGDPVGIVSLSREMRGDVDEVGYPDDVCLAFANAISPPLTALAGYSQLLLQADIVEDPSRRTRTVRAIEEHSAILSRLLDDVALVSDARTGMAGIDVESVEITSVVADAVREVENSRQGLRFVIDFEPRIGPVQVGRARLERALAGLIRLAADQTADGGNVFVSVSKRDGDAFVTMEAGPTKRAGASGRGDRGDQDSLAWHVARLVASAYGGDVDRVEARLGSIAYRMMVPVSADEAQS